MIDLGLDPQGLAAAGVPEFENFRLQQHPRAGAEDSPQLVAPVLAGVAEIADDREAGRQQVAADLVETPACRACLKQGEGERGISGKRSFPQALESGPRGERGIVGPGLQRHFTSPPPRRAAADDGVIGFSNIPQLECLLHKPRGLLVQREQQHAGRRPVEPVHRENLAPDLIAKALHRDPLDALGLPAGVDEHAGRLVDGDQAFVLIDDVKRRHSRGSATIHRCRQAGKSGFAFRRDKATASSYFRAVSFPIRSPHDTVSGIVLVARLIDKARLQAEGKLPQGYHVGLIPGNRTFDDRFCRFIDISYEEFVASVMAGGSDEEILERCLAAGRRPDQEQIEIWNGFMTKRGWRDSGTPGFIRGKAEAGLSERDDLLTFFDLMDVEEGRKP